MLYWQEHKKTEANILDSILQKIDMYKLQYSHEQFSMSFQWFIPCSMESFFVCPLFKTDHSYI